MDNETYYYTFLDLDGVKEHQYIINSSKETGVAGICEHSCSSQQLGEFGILCYAASKMDDEESIGELIDGLMGDDERFELAKRLRSLASMLEDI